MIFLRLTCIYFRYAVTIIMKINTIMINKTARVINCWNNIIYLYICKLNMFYIAEGNDNLDSY